MGALEQIRKAGLFISAKKVALILGMQPDWVRKNKHLWEEGKEYRMKNKRAYEFELSAVLRVAAERKEEFRNLKYQAAS